MPEGDTLHATAARLAPQLSGALLLRSDFRVPECAEVELAGRRVESVYAIGKHLFIAVAAASNVSAEAPAAAARSDQVVIHSHLRMEGSWRLQPAGQRWPVSVHTVRAVLRVRKTRAAMSAARAAKPLTTRAAALQDATEVEALGVNLGELHVFTPDQAEARVAHLGPDLLGKATPGIGYRPGSWDGAEALRRLRSEPDRAIGAALLDQRNLAGIGNEYRSELLFLRGIAPTRSIAAVDAAHGLEPLLLLARRAMASNLSRAARVFTGIDRRGQRHWVYGRAGRPCRRCGTPILAGQLSDIGGSEDDNDPFARRVFSCPNCQR